MILYALLAILVAVAVVCTVVAVIGLYLEDRRLDRWWDSWIKNGGE